MSRHGSSEECHHRKYMSICRSFSESLLPVLLLGLSDEHSSLQQRCLGLVEGVGIAYSHIQPLAADQVGNAALTCHGQGLSISDGTWSSLLSMFQSLEKQHLQYMSRDWQSWCQVCHVKPPSLRLASQMRRVLFAIACMEALPTAAK